MPPPGEEGEARVNLATAASDIVTKLSFIDPSLHGASTLADLLGDFFR
jgi:hypothetical protein